MWLLAFVENAERSAGGLSVEHAKKTKHWRLLEGLVAQGQLLVLGKPGDERYVINRRRG